MKRKVLTSTVGIGFAIIILYLVISTNLVGGNNPYSRYDRSYHLKNNEILHGVTDYAVLGSAPIRIKRISLINENNIPVEVKVFLCERQAMQISGGPMDRNEFEQGYGENLIPIDELHWINLMNDKAFYVVVISEEDQLEKIWVEIEYNVLGIFPKKIRSNEIII